MEHTPWKVTGSAIVYTDTGPFLEDATGTTIGRIFSGDDFSIAESAVRAVNNHDKLLEALERIVPEANNGLLAIKQQRGRDSIAINLEDAITQAREAITEARK